jgi:hypothetical protein
MKIEQWNIERVIPYARNPRINDLAVVGVVASIKEFGFRQPIVVDKDGVIIAGHTRHKAAIHLGLKEVPVHVADTLTPQQVKAYRILDNKVSEKSEWDNELLLGEIEDLPDFDFSSFDVEFDLQDVSEGKDDGEEKYTRKVESPIYEITGEQPSITELVNCDKVNQLAESIKLSGIQNKEVLNFLMIAAWRHAVFDYGKIAEFYAHSDKATQNLMEQSALVIVDFNKAIELGFIKLIEGTCEAFTAEDLSDEK